MANVPDEYSLDSNMQVPNVSQYNQFVPEHEQQGRLFTINHSLQQCMQVPEQVQHELPQATPERAHDRKVPLSEPLRDANQEAKVTIPTIGPKLNEEESSGIVTSDQLPSPTLPDIRVISGFTPEQERELLSIRHGDVLQDAIGVIGGPPIRAEEIFVTSPEPSSMATGTKRKYTRRARATSAGASNSFDDRGACTSARHARHKHGWMCQ